MFHLLIKKARKKMKDQLEYWNIGILGLKKHRGQIKYARPEYVFFQDVIK